MSGQPEDVCSCCNGTSMDELVERYAEQIAKHGFSTVAVFGDEEPTWCYTVGLQATYSHPELVIYGLDPKLAHSMMWDAVNLIRAGEVIQPGTLVGGILGDGYLMAAVEVDEPLDPRYPLNMNTHFTPREDIKAVQLVWPNSVGDYPWEPTGQIAQAVFGTFEEEA